LFKIKQANIDKASELWCVAGMNDTAQTLEAPKAIVMDASLIDDSDRVQIGCNYVKRPMGMVALAMPLIYLPLLTLVPFAAISSLFVYWHLRLLGGTNIKTYWDFVPKWITHRYDQSNQITMKSTRGAFWVGMRVFWIFNCKLYCPLSVALFSWLSYLVKLVENWWCPFGHERKAAYADASIDQSFWHLDAPDRALLHPEDRENKIWNAMGGAVEAGKSEPPASREADTDDEETVVQ